MKIALSFDFTTVDRAVEIAKMAEPYVDWIEAGASLIKQYGIRCVRQLKKAVPGKTIVAAMKLIDSAAWEVELAATAGADLVTVLGSASDQTLAVAVDAANRNGCQIIADMVAIPNPRVRTRAVTLRGVAYVMVRAPEEDAQAASDLVGDLATVASTTDRPLIISGDVTASVFERCRRFGPAIVHLGKSVTQAEDPEAAIARLRETLDTPMA